MPERGGPADPQTPASPAPEVTEDQDFVPDVFISYASQDTAVATAVVEELERSGIDCWVAPRDVTPGTFYGDEIVHAIDQAKASVLILSQNAAASPHVLREVERAASKRHPVISFRIDQVALPAGLEYFLNTSQWLDASSGDFAPSMPKLTAAVRVAIQPPSASPVPSTLGAASSSVPAGSPKRMRNMAVALIGLVLVGLAADRFWVSTRRGSLVSSGTVAPPASATATAMIPDKSVAVLPFVDMSEKHDQEYFADGLTEELIDRLAQSPDLKVIARTSSFHYKGRNDDVREIASALGVRHLLEGSVRKSGRQLRVTVQLLRASDGSHIWSDTFDKTEQDIFAVQQQIATTVTSRLNASLGSGAQADRARPTDFSAYQLLLQGDSYRGFNVKEVDASINCYRQAIAADGDYSLAWGRLAVKLAAKTQLVNLEEAAGLKREAEQAARHALQIDSNLAYGYFALGWALDFEGGKMGAAEEAYRHANLLQPGIADRLLANITLERTGNLAAAIDIYQKLLERDPKYSTLYAISGLYLFDAGRYRESESTLRQLIALEPGFAGARSYLIQTLIFEGSTADALSEMAHEDDPDNLAYEKVLVFWALGRRDESTAVLSSIKPDPDNLNDIARLNAYRGETDEAFVELNKAVDAGIRLVELKYDKYFEPLHSDPRFAAVLRRINL